MKSSLKFLIATIILIVGGFIQVNAQYNNLEHQNHFTSKSQDESERFISKEHRVLADLTISSPSSDDKQYNPVDYVAETETLEDEVESNYFKNYLYDIHNYTCVFHKQLLTQYFLCSNSRLSLHKICSNISSEFTCILFQVFRI